VPTNITLIPLPAKCPQLNPQENVWQFLRDNWLSHRIFKSYDDVVGQYCGAWNKLVDQPCWIMSIGLRLREQRWFPRVRAVDRQARYCRSNAGTTASE
jgi:hypothetical protein